MKSKEKKIEEKLERLEREIIALCDVYAEDMNELKEFSHMMADALERIAEKLIHITAKSEKKEDYQKSKSYT